MIVIRNYIRDRYLNSEYGVLYGFMAILVIIFVLFYFGLNAIKTNLIQVPHNLYHDQFGF